MSTTMRSTVLFAAATTVGATCFLPIAAPANAEACDKYMFPAVIPGSPPFDGFTFNVEFVELDNEVVKGIHVYLQTTDNEVQQAMYENPDLTGSFSRGVEGPPFIGYEGVDQPLAYPTLGTASGGLTGRTIEFKVRWENSLTTVYKGQVDDNGSASGTMKTSNGNGGVWKSTFTDFRCAPGHPLGRRPVEDTDPGADLRRAPVGDPASDLQILGSLPEVVPTNLATVVGEDVDVYDAKNEPDGAGQVIGMLRVSDTVSPAGGCTPDSWCEVSGDAVPGGRGWVWGHLELP